MKKVLDKDLEKDIEAVLKASESDKAAAHAIVEVLRKIQDAGGMKICQH